MLFNSAMVCVMAHLPGSLSCCGDFLFLAKNKHINTLFFCFVGRPERARQTEIYNCNSPIIVIVSAHCLKAPCGYDDASFMGPLVHFSLSFTLKAN